jgi:hypothetical protein
MVSGMVVVSLVMAASDLCSRPRAFWLRGLAPV